MIELGKEGLETQGKILIFQRPEKGHWGGYKKTRSV